MSWQNYINHELRFDFAIKRNIIFVVVARYEITPVKKKIKSSEENYDITDLHSDDSTDEEDAPRKKIPNWAQGEIIKNSNFYDKCVVAFKCHRDRNRGSCMGWSE